MLSYKEANKYLGVTMLSHQNINSRVVPTEYAKKQGAITNDDYKAEGGKGAGWWWLRSPGNGHGSAVSVSLSGKSGYSSVYFDHGSVRPALYIDLKSALI